MTHFFDAAILAALAFTIFQLSYLGRNIMSTQQAVDQVTATLQKVLGEVTQAKDKLVAELTALKDQIDAAGVGEQIDLSGLQSVTAALDDLNPDVVEVPAEVPAEVEGEPAEDTEEDEAVVNDPPF